MKNFMDRVRKLTALDRKTLYERTLKLAEESGEVARAVLIFMRAHGTSYRSAVHPEDIAEEAVDTIIVAASIIASLNIDDDTIDDLITKKLGKWNHTLSALDPRGGQSNDPTPLPSCVQEVTESADHKLHGRDWPR